VFMEFLVVLVEADETLEFLLLRRVDGWSSARMSRLINLHEHMRRKAGLIFRPTMKIKICVTS
nr:hypothetical protein [Tanacetum cinerariifolium]